MLLGSLLLHTGCGLKTSPQPLAPSEQQPYVQSPFVRQKGETLRVSWLSLRRPDTIRLQVWLTEPLCTRCEPRLHEELLLQEELKLGQNEASVSLPPPVAPTVEVRLEVQNTEDGPDEPIVTTWEGRPFFPNPQPLKVQTIGVEEERVLPQGEVSLILTVAEEAGVSLEVPQEGALLRRTDLIRLSWERPPEFQGTVLDEQGVLWQTAASYRVNVYRVEPSGELAPKPLNPAPLESRYWVYRRPRPSATVAPASGLTEIRPGFPQRRGAFYIDIKVIPQDTYKFAHVLVDQRGNESPASPVVSQALPATYPSWWLRALNLFPSSL